MECLTKRPGAIGQKEAKQARNLASWGRQGKVESQKGAPLQLSINASTAEMHLPTELYFVHR